MVMPWKERLSKARVRARAEDSWKFSQQWWQITLGGYLEGAAVALGNPYPLWLMRRIAALRWGADEARLLPTLRMGEVAEILNKADPIRNQTGQAAAVRFWLFCKIPYQVLCKQRGDTP